MKTEVFTARRFVVKLIIGGIEMGEVTINEGEQFEVVPVDCFLQYKKSDFLGENHGMASDGICIRAYNDLDAVTAQPEHADFSGVVRGDATIVDNLLAAIDTANALHAGVQQEKKEVEVQLVEEPSYLSPSTALLHPDVQQLIVEGKLQVGVGGIESKARVVDPRTISSGPDVVHQDAMPNELGSPPQTPPLHSTITNIQDKIEFLQNTPGCEISPARTKGEKKKPARQIPAEYISASQSGQLPKGMVEYAQKILGEDMSEGSVRVILENFVDYHLKTGKVWVDWMAVWRKWIRNERDFRKTNVGAATVGVQAPTIITDQNREELLRD